MSTISPTHTRPVDTRWIFTVRCSTAEWRINTNPISHSVVLCVVVSIFKMCRWLTVLCGTVKWRVWLERHICQLIIQVFQGELTESEQKSHSDSKEKRLAWFFGHVDTHIYWWRPILEVLRPIVKGMLRPILGVRAFVCRRRWQTGWLRALCSMVRGEIHGFVEGELPRKHITSNQSSKDGQINSSFLILRVVVRGRSHLVKWFASFISVRTGT